MKLSKRKKQYDIRRDKDAMVKYWLTNGLITDGTGEKAYFGNVLINGDRIERIQTADPTDALEKKDCLGKRICPGFIDIHSHLDWFAGNEGSRAHILPFIKQGITTVVGGNCGFSVFGFPVSHPYRELLTDNLFRAGKSRLSWRDLDGCADHIRINGCPLNMLSYIGHGTTRTSIRGYDSSPLQHEELKQLLSLLEEGLKQGAAGISLGLQYEPGVFAGKEELKAVARLAASYGRILAVHPRAASAVSGTYPMKPFGTPHHILAIQEMISLAEETGVRVQFSHLIFVGTLSWKSADKALSLFTEARKRGVDIAFDTYGYSLGASRINVILPEWFLAELRRNLNSPGALRRLRIEIKAMEIILGFGYDQIRVTNTVHPDWEQYNGLTLTEMAKKRKTGKFRTLCDLVRASNGTAGVLMERYSNPEILKKMIVHPQSLFQTDAWVEQEGINNPAIYGSLPRIFRINREEPLLPVEEIVRKMSGATADRVGIPDRGYLKEGFYADITVINDRTVSEKEENGIPGPADGIEKVIVNGKMLIDAAEEVSDENPGVFIRI